MFSYIFMKILESRPAGYDRGINILSGGHARKIKKEIVDKWVSPGIDILDIGCGTGELMAYAARKGARVAGIDISEGMLSMARKRFADPALSQRVELYHTDTSGLDRLFEDKSFDRVTATLVFSELYIEERRWVYREIARILKDSGIVVVAGEVKPRGFIKKCLHGMARFPLAAITYLISQTGTQALPDMAGELAAAGYSVLGEKRTFLDSFALVWAQKNPNAGITTDNGARNISVTQDISLFRTLWDYIGRWFPSPVEPGLRKIGRPDKDAPLFLTGNFHLTVRRVENALSGMAAWLLVAPTNGINVWCASCGGEMNTHSVIRVIKTSNILEKVSHRRMILPQFSAAGVDLRKLQQETGVRAIFGPAYASDIPKFIKHGRRKTGDMRLARYPLSFRLEMLVSMNLLPWAVISLFTLIIEPLWALLFSLLFWTAGLLLYAGYPWLPGRKGWLKGIGLSIVIIAGIVLASVRVNQQAWHTHWGWMVTALIVGFWLGFDLRGIVTGKSSEATAFLEKIGIHTIGKIYSAQNKTEGILRHDTDLCTGCRTCLGVCPQDVFAMAVKGADVVVIRPDACFTCGACVFQCPERALEIN